MRLRYKGNKGKDGMVGEFVYGDQRLAPGDELKASIPVTKDDNGEEVPEHPSLKVAFVGGLFERIDAPKAAKPRKSTLEKKLAKAENDLDEVVAMAQRLEAEKAELEARFAELEASKAELEAQVNDLLEAPSEGA